jgi:hypothetical protein
LQCIQIDVPNLSAKYPLAIIAKATEVLPPNFIGAYDISCEFSKTVMASSLGHAFKSRGGQICVNAFHGYSHNYACQLQHHPNIIEGTGLEDLETLEHIFSSSNQLATVIRYATAFRDVFLLTCFSSNGMKKNT